MVPAVAVTAPSVLEIDRSAAAEIAVSLSVAESFPGTASVTPPGAATVAVLEIVPVVNQWLGETITVAGLLMGQDVIDRLLGRDLGDLVVLPHIMFDHPDGIALDDVGPDQITQVLDCPIVLADGMNDLWEALLARCASGKTDQ